MESRLLPYGVETLGRIICQDIEVFRLISVLLRRDSCCRLRFNGGTAKVLRNCEE